MADFNTNSHQTSSSHTTTNTSEPTVQITTTSSHGEHSGGIFRTASGRETYHPDGHETSTGPFCEHEEVHSSVTSSPVTRHSYGIFPQTTEDRTYRSSASHDVPGAGLFGGLSGQSENQVESSNVQSERQVESTSQGTEEVVPLEKVESSASSSSSTRYGSGDQKKRRASSSDEDQGGVLQRHTTRSEIDDEGRRELSRIYTAQSQKKGRQMSIAQPGDPSVDPSSDSFDLTKFLKMFREQLQGEGVYPKKLSVVFKDLNVFGSGKALQLQKTVADIPLAPFRVGEYFGKSDRKQILHDFDGIIKAGELCVVLGRPGSGCSTLLKALTGELHGLDTDESVIHYNGISQKRMIKEFKGETIYNQVSCVAQAEFETDTYTATGSRQALSSFDGRSNT